MIDPIVATNRLVTLVGGGEVGRDDLSEALALAPVLVAADGGADAALAQGHAPEAVIGDFDSLSPRAMLSLPQERLHPIAEQDSTDFDKALRNIAAPLVLAVGFLGARIDHQLAAMNVLARRPDRRCILIGADQIVFCAPPRLSLDLTEGTLVSLYPMDTVTGRSQGLVWPIDGMQLDPAGRIGTSNAARGQVELDIDRPGLLVILPRPALACAMAGLMAAQTTWPGATAPDVHS
ncbi:MAG: thiamine diphosphokinase [Marinibacterium sp.]